MLSEALLMARVMRPYYAKALACLQPYAVDGIGTIAIGKGYQLFVDCAWFEQFKPKQRAALIACHEIEHVLRKHLERGCACGAEPVPFNIAGDLEINDDAKKELPNGCVQPAHIGKPEGLLAEEYYQILMEMAADQRKQDPNCGGGSGAGNPKDYEGDTPGMSQSQTELVRKATAKDVIAAHGKNPGSVPAGVVVWAKEALEPVRIPWDRALNAVLAKRCHAIKQGRQDYSYRRLHRRQRPMQVVRPAPVKYDPEIALVVDTSGSMHELGPKVLGTVNNIAQRFGRVKAFCCDVEVHRVHGDLRRVEWKGGGGTDLRPAIAEAEATADAVVVVTDGFTPWPQVLKVPLIVVLLDEGGRSSGIPTNAVVISIAGEQQK